MSRIRIAVLLGLLGAGLGLVAAMALGRGTPTFHGTLLPEGTAAAPFTLEAADRGPVSLSQFEGKAVLMFFGYTRCPDACPATMAKLTRVMELVGDRRRDVQVLLVSVDPELDTPRDVRAYVQDFDLGFVGLTGTRERITRIARDYGVYVGEVEGDAAGGGEHEGMAGHAGPGSTPRLIPHTTHLFGIDRSGELRVLWDLATPADEIAADVRSLLRL